VIVDLLAVAGSRAQRNAPLGARTTLRVGGAAAVLLTIDGPADLAELAPVLAACGGPVLVVGHGSNLLVADAGFDGVAVVLGDGFARAQWRDVDDRVVVTAGAAISLPVLARRLADDGVVGFEWAVGVPGTIGGAVAMNAGGHGGDMAGCVDAAEVVSGATGAILRPAAALGFRYRGSAIGPGELVSGATLVLARGDRTDARAQISEIVRWRREHQPGGANCGSVFQNPPGTSAGELIERAGLRGFRLGTARVSEKHANFIMADEGGAADDVLALMRAVREAVAASSGVTLVSEVRVVGFASEWP
jgi:UDP-N-acetylmuramate dehydrogenase